MKKLCRMTGLILLICLLLLPAAACKKEEDAYSETVAESNAVYVYYLNRDRTRIQGEEFFFRTDTPDEQLIEMVEALGRTPEHNELKTSLGKDFSILAYEMKDGNLTLNLSTDYKKIPSTEEILVRAALVRSFDQVEGVNFIQFLVEGESLLDAEGMTVGLLSSDSFVENDGQEINAYERVNITLYFATEDGKHLIAGQRQVVYNTNVSMEKMVVEQLIKGPTLTGYYPTINPDTKILSVTNKDGTCYVNLSEDFLKQPYDVSADAVVYSIANSLTGLNTVNKIQIQVGGSSKIMFRETKSLEDPIERNLDIVVKEEED